MEEKNKILAVIIFVFNVLLGSSCLRTEEHSGHPASGTIEEMFPIYPRVIITSLDSAGKLSEVTNIPVIHENNNLFFLKGVPVIRVEKEGIEKIVDPGDFEADTLIFFEFPNQEGLQIVSDMYEATMVKIKNKRIKSMAYVFSPGILFVMYAAENKMTCIMHPHITLAKFRHCPICDMELIE